MHKPQRVVDTPLPKIRDKELLSLIAELHHATTVQPENTYLLWGFLMQCHYPLGAGDWFEIDKSKIIPGGILSRKVGKLQGTVVYQMCEEIAQTRAASAELALNMSLYVFLNKFFPDLRKKQKKRRHDPRDWF